VVVAVRMWLTQLAMRVSGCEKRGRVEAKCPQCDNIQISMSVRFRNKYDEITSTEEVRSRERGGPNYRARIRFNRGTVLGRLTDGQREADSYYHDDMRRVQIKEPIFLNVIA
jgi:hypothetical protein